MADDRTEDYGARIRQRRQANGITLTELAGEMGVPVSTLSEYERGAYAMPEAVYHSGHAAIARIREQRRQADERIMRKA